MMHKNETLSRDYPTYGKGLKTNALEFYNGGSG